MKKMLFGAAMLCVALTGCENEDFTAANQSQVMRFDAPAMMKTRANVQGEIIGTLYDFREDFKVYSKSYKGTFAGWETGTEDYFQAAGDVAKNQGNESKYWYTENVYYWPEIDYNLAFAAYSPAAFGTAAGATVSHTAAGLQIEGFKTEASANDQYDLMYSDRIVDRNKSNNGSSAVPLVFHHALSSIVFSTEKEDESVNYEITSIRLHGNFIQQADFNQNIVEATDKLSGVAKWENPAAATVADFTPTISTTGKVDVTTVPTQFTQKESALLLIPQVVPAEAYITVVYNKITNPDDPALKKVMVNSATIKLTDFAQEGGNKITEWEMGKRYIYRIAFGQNKRIYFEPTTTDWIPVPTLIYTIQ